MAYYKETKCYYWTEDPVFDHYEDVEIIDYCETCGQEEGSHTESRGVNQVGTKITKHKKDIWFAMAKVTEKYILPRVVDSIMEPSIFDKLK